MYFQRLATLCITKILPLLILMVSCATEEPLSPIKPTTETESPSLVDDYKYIAIDGGGNLYELGNNSGSLKNSGKIQGADYNVFGNVSANNKYFVYQQIFEPREGIFYIYDKVTKATLKKSIGDLSSFGAYPFMYYLGWDKSNETLISIINEDETDPSSLNHVVRINPETMEISNTGITYSGVFINLCIKDNILYMTPKIENGATMFLTKINLQTMEVDNHEIMGTNTNLSGFSSNSINNQLFTFVNNPQGSIVSCFTPSLLNLENFEIAALQTEQLACRTRGISGNSYYSIQAGEHVDIVNLTENNPNPNALLRYNLSTNKTKLVVLKDDGSPSNSITIIDAIKQ
jgi:hypothetical protein